MSRPRQREHATVAGFDASRLPLHALSPIALQERQEVTVTISDEETIAPDHPLLVSPEEWADADKDDVSLDELRRAGKRPDR